MTFSFTQKNKPNKLTRAFGSALIAVVIGVNAFGAFAGVVSAQAGRFVRPLADLSQEVRTLTPQLNTAIETARNSTGTARTTAIEQVQSLEGRITELMGVMVRQNGGNADPSLVGARAATESARDFIRGGGTNGTTNTERNSGTVQTQSRAAVNTSSGAAPRETKPTATHPVDICFSREITASICIASIFYVFFVDLTSPIAYLSGAVFDAFANVSLESGTYASDVIAKGWVIARDIANMAFVFILIYIAFMLILNLEGVGIARQIAGVIAVALLINFSFFFTRVVIDISNILAHEFYSQIDASPSLADPSLLIQGAKLAAPISISEKVMAGVNPQNLMSEGSFKKFNEGGSFVGNLAILIVLFLIFGIVNVVLAAVFLTAAFQFLTRIVALWFAIILSPIAFISFITPKMNGVWTKWLNLLVSNAFYAPAFLFVIYIAVKMLDGGLMTANIASFLGGQADLAKQVGGPDGMKTFLNSIVGVVLRLSVVVGLFIAALKVGSYVGVAGGSQAEKWGKGLAIGGNAALVGGLGRRTFGIAGNALSRNEFVNNRAAMVGGFDKDGNKTRTFGGLMARTVGYGIGRGAKAIGDKAATSSFDARGSQLFSYVPEGSDAGKAQSGGYKQAVADKADLLKKRVDDLQDTPEQKRAKEIAYKTSTGYVAKENDINEDIKRSIREKDTHESDMADAEIAIARAQQAGNAAAEAAAKNQLAISKKAYAQASQAERNHTKALKELAERLKDFVDEDDKDRKRSSVSLMESRGIHNLWRVPTLGVRSQGTLRAAAKTAQPPGSTNP